MNKKNIVFMVLGMLLLVSCGKSNDSNKIIDQPIKIGVVSGSSPTQVFEVAEEVLKKDGFKVDVQVFSDFNSPNAGVFDGGLDYNFYQHIAFLDEYNKSNNTDLVQVGGGVYKITYGLFSDKIESIDEIEEGMTIAIQNDISNRATSLRMLEKDGIIKLNSNVDMPTLTDIEENKYNLEFVEMEETMIISSLSDVDIGCVSCSQWNASGRDPEEALSTIAMDDSTLVLVTRNGNEDSEISKAIQKALNSDEVREFLENNYSGIATPTF